MRNKTTDPEIQELEKICQKIAKTKSLTTPQLNHLKNLFENRFENAWKALNENRVKKYTFTPSQRTIWIVVGKERDYQIIPTVNYCTCDDFYYRVINGTTPLCYHIIAQKLAQALDIHDTFEESDELYTALMKEWGEFEE